MKSICIKHFRALLTLLLFVAAAGGNGAWAQDFTIEASHNSSTHKTTFKIKRSGDYLPQQTVNFRTVNLSAYAGEHYTAVSGTYTFPANDTIKTVEVTESAASTEAYKYQNGTTRSYRFEVLDVNGFELAHYDRSMTTGTQFSNAKVSKEITDLVYFNGTSYASGLSSSKYLDVSFTPPSGWTNSDGYVNIDDEWNYGQRPAVVSTNSLINTTNATRTYLDAMGVKVYATVCFTMKEVNDGYQYVQIIEGNASAAYDGTDPNPSNNPTNYVNLPSNSLYKTCFELYQPGSSAYNSPGKQFFPHRYDYHNRTGGSQSADHTEFYLADGYMYQQRFKSSSYRASNSGSVVISPTVENITTRFDCAGGGNDTWGYKDFFVRMALCDATKPKLLNNSTAGITVSAGPYVKGNTFYISVPFSEIVHISGAPQSLVTSWGRVYYESGDYTNVITFKGTINANADEVLAITSIDGCLFNDQAGNYDNFSNSSFNKTFNGITCSAIYTLDNYNTVFTGLANEYVLSDNGPIEPVPTTIYFYKGTKTTDHRTTLTPTTHYTLAWSDNTAAGDGTVTATGVAPYTGSASTTFPIRWSTYTVRFHQNDGPYGTHATEDQTFTYNTAQNLNSTLTREGYTVARWTTNADGSGTSYGATQSVSNLTPTDGDTIHLYARWAVIPWTGTGDNANDPYIILYASQLDSLAATVNSGNNYSGKYFQLGADITYADTTNWNDANSTENNYTAIGNQTNEFSGTFDGANYTVSGIRIFSTNYQGLFGNIYNATVQNVTISDAHITGYSSLGGIAGCIYQSTVQNCLVLNAAITGISESGAVVGYKYSGTLSHNYYRNCIVNVGSNTYTTNIGLGAPQNDHAGEVASLHTLSLPANVTATGESIVIDAVTYYAHLGTVTLTYIGDPGYSISYSYQLSTTNYPLPTNTFTMPGADITVSRTLTDRWGIGSGHDGTTEALAYLISDTAGLNLLARYVNGTDGYAANGFSGKYFRMTNNITYDTTGLGVTESNYTAIGGYFDGWKGFRGTFDGDNDTISGIRIFKGGTTNADGYQGLFGYVYGTIKNVTLTDAVITGKQCVGGIVGNITTGGIIDNCHVTASVTLHAVANTAYWHGGIVGDVNGGSVSGCTSAATLSYASGLTGCDYYGGLAGSLTGNLLNCLVLGATVSGTDMVGAVVGYKDDGYTYTANYYRGCTVNGTVNAINVGTGNNGDSAGIRSLHTLTLGDGITATGASETKVIGTTTYYASNSTITLNYTGTPATGYVFDNINVDAGTLSGSTFTFDPAADVTISATFTDVWGVTNTPAADGSQEHPYVISDTTGLNLLARNVNGTHGYTANGFEGKFFRLANNITYSHEGLGSDESNYTAIGGYFNGGNSYFRGTFDGQGDTISGIRIYKGGETNADGRQGLFGIVSGGTVKNVTLTDAVITGKQYVGGIVGYITKYSGTGGIIDNCHVTGSVTLHAVADYADWHGGIVGNVNGGTVSGCTSAATLSYASGLTGCEAFGGIVGDLNGHLQNCLVVGTTVSGTNYVGAVVGHNTGTVTNCHHRRCSVNDTPQNDLYTVTPGTDVTLSPAGTATATYPYGGIEVYGSALYYGDTLYAANSVSVGLTLGYTGSSAHHYGYEASSGTLTGTDNPYSLTLAAADVVVDAITCEHGNNPPSFDLDVMDVCVGSDGNWVATLEALALGAGNHLADDYTPVDELTVSHTFDAEPYDATDHPYGYLINSEGPRIYYCTWTVADGCGNASTMGNNVIVRPLPLITITDSLQTVAYGEAIETMNINVAYQSTYTVTGSAEGLTYDQGEHKLAGTPTEVGTYNYSVEATSQWGCASTTAPITITVTPRPITITATDDTKEYDGTPLTSTAYTCSRTAPFTADQVLAFSDVIANINITGSQTIVGSNSNTPSALVITDGGNPAVDKSASYAVTYQPGTLTVTPNTSDITVVPGSGTKVYDGTPLTRNELSDFTVTGVPDGFTWTATANGTVTNVIPDDFDYDNEVNAVSSFVIRNAAGEEVTDYFSNIDLSATGTLTVTPREATVRACVAYKPYDGTSLKCTECTYSGIVEGDTVVALASGKQTQIGTSVNMLLYVYVFNGDEELITDNYHITKVHGTLTVTPRVDINAGRWHAVSTPMHDDGEDHWTFGDALATGLYDLFRYDEPTATWENQKGGTFDHMEPARGYLYRSSQSFAIPYDGLFNSAATYSIGLTANGSGDLRGFNLVGNPYPFRVKLDRAFYALNSDGSWTLHPNGDSIAAGQGALVYATAPETLTFYAATRSTNPGKKGALPHINNVGSEMDDETSDIIPPTSDLFAHWEGDQLVVTGEGLLQAYDALGRELLRQEVSPLTSHLSPSLFPQPGVYVLRLNGQSQKIVIR